MAFQRNIRGAASSLLTRLGLRDAPSHRCRYLIAPAGVPNFGDELVTRAWLRKLAKAEPDSEVWLDCISPSHAAHLFHSDHPHLHVTSTVWSLVWAAQNETDEVTDYERQYPLVESWVRELGTPREDLGLLQLLAADSIHLIGGGHITGTLEANHSLIPRIAAVAAEESGACLFATGLGIAPWAEGDIRLDAVRDDLRRFDYVSFRDYDSARLSGGIGKVSGDDAWLALADGADGVYVSQPHNPDLDAYDARAFVSLNPNRSPLDEAGTVRRVADVLRRSGVAESEPITMVEAMVPEDGVYLDAMREEWRGDVRLLPFSVLWREGFPRKEGSVWVASRYHMHLIGAAAGASGVAVMGGDGYYATKHGALLFAGTGWSKLMLGDESSQPRCTGVGERFEETKGWLSAGKQVEFNELYLGE